MKEHALSVFRKDPERLNCAQSVLHAWREVSGDTSIALADLKPLGGGRAPDGLCGALHTVCVIAPGQSESLKKNFAARLGSLFCKELCASGVHPCEACVGQATELLEFRITRDRQPPLWRDGNDTDTFNLSPDWRRSGRATGIFWRL